MRAKGGAGVGPSPVDSGKSGSKHHLICDGNGTPLKVITIGGTVPDITAGHDREESVRIGELASRAGVSVRSVRYYKEQRLLTSARSASGQRHYTDGEVERVAFIQRLYAAGLSSRTITVLLPCVDAPSEKNSDSALERTAQERDRLSAHIADLVRTRDALDGRWPQPGAPGAAGAAVAG